MGMPTLLILRLSLLTLLCLCSFLAHSASISQTFSETRGRINAMSIAALPVTNLFVTALRDSEDKLRLMVWAVRDNGSARIVENFATAGTIRDVSVYAPDDSGSSRHRFVTAIRGKNGRLKLIAWSVNRSGGGIRRDAETGTDIRVNDIEVTGSGTSIVVAARQSDQKLIVVRWSWNEDSFELDRVRRFGNVGNIALTGLGDNPALAAQNSSDNLLLTWFTGSLRRSTSGGGGIRDVAITNSFSGFPSNEVVTFSIDRTTLTPPVQPRCNFSRNPRGPDDGIVKLIAWRLTNTADLASPLYRTRVRQFEGEGGVGHTVGVAAVSQWLISAHAGYRDMCGRPIRDRADPQLLIRMWNMNTAPLEADEGAPEILQQEDGASLRGSYVDIEMAGLGSIGDHKYVAIALKESSDNLKLTIWRLKN